jgi:hypothetical protein
MYLIGAMIGLLMMFSAVISYLNVNLISQKVFRKTLAPSDTAEKMLDAAMGVYGVYVSFDVYDVFSSGYFVPNPVSNLAQQGILPKDFNDRTQDGGQIMMLNFKDPCDPNLIDVILYVNNFGSDLTVDVDDEEVKKSLILNEAKRVVYLLKKHEQGLQFPDTYDACSGTPGKGVRIGYVQEVNGSLYLEPYGLKLDANFPELKNYVKGITPAVVISAPNQVGFQIVNIMTRPFYAGEIRNDTGTIGLFRGNYVMNSGYSLSCPDGAINLATDSPSAHFYYAYTNQKVFNYAVGHPFQFCIPIYKNEYKKISGVPVTICGINTAKRKPDGSLMWYSNKWNVPSAPGISNGVGIQDTSYPTNEYWYLGFIGDSEVLSLYSNLTKKYYVIAVVKYYNMAGNQNIQDPWDSYNGNYIYGAALIIGAEVPSGQSVVVNPIPQLGLKMGGTVDSLTSSYAPYCAVTPQKLYCTFPLVQADGTFKYTCNSTDPNCATIPVNLSLW